MHGYTAQAITFFEQALAVKESIQGDLKIEELKASYASEQVDSYERLIVLLWNEGQFQAVRFTYLLWTVPSVWLESLREIIAFIPTSLRLLSRTQTSLFVITVLIKDEETYLLSKLAWG
jgi:hypothetical protein